MTSLRNNDDEPTMADRLLTAARESILLVGWKRTTLTDIASRAGVSRMTVYRTYADMTELLADLMMREQAALVAAAVDSVDVSRDWPDRLAIGVARTVAALRENDLFRRMIDVDPEWAPALPARAPRTLPGRRARDRGRTHRGGAACRRHPDGGPGRARAHGAARRTRVRAVGPDHD